MTGYSYTWPCAHPKTWAYEIAGVKMRICWGCGGSYLVDPAPPFVLQPVGKS